MHQQITLPAIDAVQKRKKGATDYFLICDLPGLADVASTVSERNANRSSSGSFRGKMSFDDSMNAVRNGDMAGVAASEKLLDRLESRSIISPRWRMADDVCGAVPNVPAFIAGHPFSMRRRIRTASDMGPLCVFADITVSTGFSAAQILSRGAAMLALVRTLATKRPIELWATMAVGCYGNQDSYCIAARIDTAPLDLARAAHVLTHASVLRGLGFGIFSTLWPVDQNSIPWAYKDQDLYRRTARESLARVVNPGSDVLYLAAAHWHDNMSDVEKWLLEMLAKYGGETVQDDAA